MSFSRKHSHSGAFIDGGGSMPVDASPRQQMAGNSPALEEV